jgi:hypothetical protein
MRYAEFAESHGLIPDPTHRPHGGLFALSLESEYDHVCRGAIGEDPFWMFEWTASIGESSPLVPNFMFAVAQTPMSKRLPEFYLCPVAMKGLIPAISARGVHKLELEGSFGQEYALYVASASEVENLEVFTPDLMEALVTGDAKTLLFANGDSVYWLREAGLLQTSQMQLEPLYDVMQSALPSLLRNVDVDNFDTVTQGIPTEALSVPRTVVNYQNALLIIIPGIAWFIGAVYIFCALFK